MRIRFDEQLEQLNEEMINMGNMIEASIGLSLIHISEPTRRS